LRAQKGKERGAARQEDNKKDSQNQDLREGKMSKSYPRGLTKILVGKRRKTCNAGT